jgi:hypothetical protein
VAEVYSLTAARQAREEAIGGPRPVEFFGETFEFPPELPIDYGLLLDQGNLRGAVALMVGDDHVDRFMDLRPSANDLIEVARMYGVEMGESAPSAPPLNRAGRRSRATSNGGTSSTSATSAGGRVPSGAAAS